MQPQVNMRNLDVFHILPYYRYTRAAHGLDDANQPGQLNRCRPKSGEAHSSGSCGGGSGSWALGAASIAVTASVGAASAAWPFVARPSSIGMVMFVPGSCGRPPTTVMVVSRVSGGEILNFNSSSAIRLLAMVVLSAIKLFAKSRSISPWALRLEMQAMFLFACSMVCGSGS